jgi:hypothetical protein
MRRLFIQESNTSVQYPDWACRRIHGIVNFSTAASFPRVEGRKGSGEYPRSIVLTDVVVVVSRVDKPDARPLLSASTRERRTQRENSTREGAEGDAKVTARRLQRTVISTALGPLACPDVPQKLVPGNPCTDLHERPGKARQRFLTCSTCVNVRIKSRARVRPATRRLQQRGGEVGDC